MDTRTEDKLVKILYASLAVMLVFVTIQNTGNPWPFIFLSGVLALSVTVRHLITDSPGRFYNAARLTFLVDISAVFLINFFDRGASSQIYYFIVIGDAAVIYTGLFASGVTAAGFVAYAAAAFLRSGSPDPVSFLSGIAPDSLAFIAVLAIMSVVRYEILQRQKLSRTMYQLKLKTKQLEDAYVKLRETSDELEDMTILKERNRIAREIHDTVGHTLTTVLIELEAGERLIARDPDLAAEKVRLAKGQVRKGLADIRESVGMLDKGREILGLADSMKLLMEETTCHGGIHINHEISELPPLADKQEKALYRALQEGLTNGIRHGGSTAFVFKLTLVDGDVRFFLQDNGTGTDNIVPGFGLTAMEERVKESGGIFSVCSSPGEGFSISIVFPSDKGYQPVGQMQASIGEGG